RSIADKVEFMGWEMLPKGSKGKIVRKIPEDIVETLAIIEHEEWIKERLTSGWVYGKEKDSDKKVSPYLIPFDELTEEIKDYDRDTIRNIPVLLELIGMAVYVKKSKN
ncbi:MAG: RyR domain-containing protein, partial [Anaerolineaceae bacterium]|nr:RyR domain-containing protein [Anaerolineaceae bacterium]